MPLDNTRGAGLVEVNREKHAFRVHRSAYKSRDVFEQEKTLIFGKCWLYVGHGTELKKKGDFAARRVGGRDLIFIRDRENEVRAFHNSCTHRGAKICRERGGSARIILRKRKKTLWCSRT